VRVLSSALPWVLVLWMGSVDAAQPRLISCQRGVRHVELPSIPTGEVPEVCISPGLPTTFGFDTDIVRQSVTLEGAERFTKIDEGDSTLRLVPSEKILPGEKLRLTLRFKDGAAPMSVAFWLVVHPVQAEPLVEVYRQKRTLESCQQELMDKDAQLRQCQEENALWRTEQVDSGGLTALLDAGLMNGRGVAGKRITEIATHHPESFLLMYEAYSYHSNKRVAVELWLGTPKDGRSWKAAGAELMGSGHRALRVLPPLQRETIRADDQKQRVLIEADATQQEAKDTFTLKIWDASGVRSFILSGVTFP
jgi:uncharacterized protein (TIGR02268 family)